jgi:hypothetical protein
MSRPYVVLAEQSHYTSLIDNLRASDVEEVESSTGVGANLVLAETYAKTKKSYAVIHDNKTVAVFGCNALTSPGDIGVPWLLATDQIESITWPFSRECRLHIESMLIKYSLLMNYVLAKNTKSVRWLKWCGFEVFPPKPFGPYEKPFHLFIKRR